MSRHANWRSAFWARARTLLQWTPPPRFAEVGLDGALPNPQPDPISMASPAEPYPEQETREDEEEEEYDSADFVFDSADFRFDAMPPEMNAPPAYWSQEDEEEEGEEGSHDEEESEEEGGPAMEIPAREGIVGPEEESEETEGEPATDAATPTCALCCVQTPIPTKPVASGCIHPRTICTNCVRWHIGVLVRTGSPGMRILCPLAASGECCAALELADVRRQANPEDYEAYRRLLVGADATIHPQQQG
eukprot:EG_transcript_1850